MEKFRLYAWTDECCAKLAGLGYELSPSTRDKLVEGNPWEVAKHLYESGGLSVMVQHGANIKPGEKDRVLLLVDTAKGRFRQR